VNSLVESLERIESHAKALTSNNLDLRARLKTSDEEKYIWERKYRQVNPRPKPYRSRDVHMRERKYRQVNPSP
jgi:hypothetical protein